MVGLRFSQPLSLLIYLLPDNQNGQEQLFPGSLHTSKAQTFSEENTVKILLEKIRFKKKKN